MKATPHVLLRPPLALGMKATEAALRLELSATAGQSQARRRRQRLLLPPLASRLVTLPPSSAHRPATLRCLFLGLPKSCCSISAFGDVAAVSDDFVESSPSSSGYLNIAMDASSHEDNQSERAVKMNQNSRDNNKMIKICDKLIGVFLVDKPTPTDWRKLLAFSREWDNIRPHFFKRCQEKADTELNPEMKHNLLRLGRKLKEIDEDVKRHNELLEVVKSTPSDKLGSIVAKRRKDFTVEFFNHLYYVAESYHDEPEKQTELAKLGNDCVDALQAHDDTTGSLEALNAAELKLKDILNSPLVDAACRKIDDLAEKKELDSALVLMLSKAWSVAKGTDITKSEPMASSLVSRPHLTQRPVRAATLASPTHRARLVAGALGGRCQAQAAGDLDSHYMRRCVELARKAAGHTSPNPMVGCVIVRDGRVVGEGFHPKAGQPHAEVFALRDAGNLAENATAYVSLEPCNHYGRTPPCTEALINAKVKEVVIGMTDPNPIVASKGIEKLQGAGINVRVGVEEALCRKLNEAYIHRMLTGKAFATLRATLSMNGIVTNQIGKGADQSGGYYSQLMKEYDGIIISSDLAKLSSLPLSREAGANQPLYIIIAQGENSRLHIPSLSEEHASKVIVLADSPVTVEAAGVEVAVLCQIDLESILQLLAQRGLCNVLVDFREAGESFSSLLNDFQEDKLVQKVVVEILPFWLASEGFSNLAFGGSQSFPLKNLKHREVNGGSVLLEGYV